MTSNINPSMRLFISFLIISAHLSFAQPVTMTPKDGELIFQKVIELDSVSEAVIYKKSLHWILESYKSPDDVIKLKIENEELRGKGFAEGALLLGGIASGDLEYIFTIDVKPSKVRFTVNSMVCYFTNSHHTMETYVLKKDGTLRTNSQATDLIERSTKFANSLIRSFENALKTSSSKKDDW